MAYIGFIVLPYIRFFFIKGCLKLKHFWVIWVIRDHQGQYGYLGVDGGFRFKCYNVSQEF